MNTLKLWLRCICFLLLLAVLFVCATAVLERKTLDGPWNYTAKVSGFLNTAPDTLDLIGFGSSHMYCTLNPNVLETYGINSYVLATQQQPLQATYHYMVEALKTQHPKVFILETYMVNYFTVDLSDSIMDSIIADATEPLPLSFNKLQMIHALTKHRENQLPYYLTLFRYSGRWKELTDSDFGLDRRKLYDATKGYVYLTDATELEYTPYTGTPTLLDIDAVDREYLDKIVKLCKENGIKLIFLYAPFSMDETSHNLNYTVKCYAEEQGIEYIDTIPLIDQLQLDFKTDFYDVGHLNYSGSTKVSEFLAEYLLENNLLD